MSTCMHAYYLALVPRPPSHLSLQYGQEGRVLEQGCGVRMTALMKNKGTFHKVKGHNSTYRTKEETHSKAFTVILIKCCKTISASAHPKRQKFHNFFVLRIQKCVYSATII